MKIMVWFGLVLGAFSAAEEVILAKLGQTATLKCNANTYRRLEWLHKGSRILSIDGSTGQPRKGTSDIVKRSTVRGASLVVASLKDEDAGRFKCTVDGKPQEHLLLLTSVSSTPSGDLQLGSEATLRCQVKGLDPGSTVQWNRPDESQTGSDTVQLKPVTDSHSGTWKCLFTHNSKTYTESLNVSVKDPKTATTSPPEKTKKASKPGCTNCPTEPPPKSHVLLELSWWVWVAIGVGSLVVIVLIIIIIVMCKKIRRKKRKYQRNQNGHHPLKPRQYCQCNRPTAAAKPQQGRRREKPVALPRQPLLME